MCLSIAVDFPERVLAKGEHLGFEWVVTHNDQGFRCGYVRVPKGHPWHGLGSDQIDAAVHGGLTFGDFDKPCDGGRPDDAYWLGFDAAHSWDAPDPALPCKEAFMSFRDTLLELRDASTVTRTQEYVENECRNLCAQALTAAELRHAPTIPT